MTTYERVHQRTHRQLDEELDTADVLRAIKHKIRQDFVVMSGDVVTDVYVHHLFDVHRVNDSTCTLLLRGPKVSLSLSLPLSLPLSLSLSLTLTLSLSLSLTLCL